MEKSKRKLSKILRRLIVVSIIFFALFAGAFMWYASEAAKVGDPDLVGFGGVMNFHLKGVVSLFTFSYANGHNAMYYAISAFLYALILCWVIFLIAGLVINSKKKRKLMWWGIVLTLVNVLVYLVLASGSQKFWCALNSSGCFTAKNDALLPALLTIILGLLFMFLSIAVYFWSIIEIYMDAMEEQENDSRAVSDEDVRQIVKEELVNSQPFKVYVVGGALQTVVEEEQVQEEEPEPQPEPEPVVEPEPEPEPIPEPEPEPVVMEEPKEEEIIDIPLREEEPEEEVMEVPVEEGDMFDSMNKKARETFLERILKAELETKANYNEIKNEALAYGLKARLSRGGEIFRLHKKKYMKIFLVGKTLKVYLALPPEDYKDSTFPIEDVGHRPNYAEMPLLFKVRSGLSVRRCKELIKAAAEKDGLQKEEYEGVNWVNELRTLNAEKAKEDKNK